MKLLRNIIGLIILLVGKSSCQNSQCNSYWKYIYGDDQSTQGLITIFPKLSMQIHVLRVSLTVSTKLPTSYFGSIDLFKDTQSTVNDMANGGAILYRVKFPVQSPLPQLTEIYYNNELLCGGKTQQSTYGYWTTIQLHHTLYTNLPPIQSSYENFQQPAVAQRPNGNYQPKVEWVRQPAYNLPNVLTQPTSVENQKLPNNYQPKVEWVRQPAYIPQSQEVTTGTPANNYQPKVEWVRQPAYNLPKVSTQQTPVVTQKLSNNYQPKVEWVRQPSYIPQSQEVTTDASVNNYHSKVQQPQEVTTQAPPVNHFFSTKPPVFLNNYDRINNNFQCGVPFRQLSEFHGLVVNGNPAEKGQFPWLAAFFYNSAVSYSGGGIICGGSLVSKKHVITAAHCIQDKSQSDTNLRRREDECFFLLGKHSLREYYEGGFVQSGVSQFIMHPDYNANVESFDADLAIAVLQRTIIFTNFIQPICIWTQTSGYYDIVHKHGVVAGWGKTGAFVTASEKPFWARLPIVNETECLRSNSVFGKITSSRTFCAGARDGSGPCQGDSGGPFMVKSVGKYYLRGIVSSALFDRELLMCDTKNYAVFTDIAQYKEWIFRIIN